MIMQDPLVPVSSYQVDVVRDTQAFLCQDQLGAPDISSTVSENSMSSDDTGARWGGRWCPPVTRPTRDWDSIILPETTKDDLLRDIKNFFSDKGKNFYAARGRCERVK